MTQKYSICHLENGNVRSLNHPSSSSDDAFEQFSSFSSTPQVETANGTLILHQDALYLNTVESENRLEVTEKPILCRHGVTLTRCVASLRISSITSDGSACLVTSRDGTLWSFPHDNVQSTIYATKLDLDGGRARKTVSGRDFFVVLAENLQSTHKESNTAEGSESISTKCKECSDNVRLRLSALMIEADREADLKAKHEVLVHWKRRSRGMSCDNPSSVVDKPETMSLRSLREEVVLPDQTLGAKTSDLGFSFVSLDRISIMEQMLEIEDLESEKQSTSLPDLLRDVQEKNEHPSLEIWTFGSNDYGQLGFGDTCSRFSPTLVSSLNSCGIIDIACGETHVAALTSNGEVYIWGENISLHGNDSFITSPRLQKLGLNMFAYDILCTKNELFILLVSNDKTTNLYKCSLAENRPSVVRISLPDKSGIAAKMRLINDRVEVLCLHDDSYRCEIVSMYFEIAKYGNLLQGLSQITEKLKTKPSEEEDRERLEQLDEAVTAYSIQIKRFLLMLRSSFVSSEMKDVISIYSFLADSPLILTMTKCVEIFCFVCAYGILTGLSYSSELEQTISRLALQHASDAGKSAATIEKLFGTVTSLLNFFMCHARESMALDQSEDIRLKISSILKLWKSTYVLLSKRVQAASATRKYWTRRPHMQHLRMFGRLFLESFTVGTNGHILKVNFEQPKFYIQPKINNIIIFCDLFVIEEANQKAPLRTYPLNLVWIEKIDDANLFRITTPDVVIAIQFENNEDNASTSDNGSVLPQNIFSYHCNSWWDRLGNTVPVPITRYGNYSFRSECWREGLRGSCYEGQWRLGRLSGRGTLTTADGDVMKGTFVDDALHGFGEINKVIENGSSSIFSTFYVPFPTKDEKVDVYRGIFQNGKLNGLAQIRYADGGTYNGYTLNDKPHGFGVHRSKGNLHIGEFVDGQPSGYGLSVNNREKCMGEFSQWKLNGRGVLVSLDGCVAEGEWQNNCIKRGKISAPVDDNGFSMEYEGELIADTFGEVGKQGTLVVAKGVTLEGTFSGNLMTGTIRVVDANVKTFRAEPNHFLTDSEELKLSQWAKSPETRWSILFETFRKHELSFTEESENNTVKVWQEVARGMRVGKMLVDGDVRTGFCDAIEKVPDFDAPWSSMYYAMCSEYWRLALDNSYHPLHRLLFGVVDVFNFSYNDVATHKRLYAHAVLEAENLICGIYDIIRLLFPNLPEDCYTVAPCSSLPCSPTSSPESSPEKSSSAQPINFSVPIPICDFIYEAFFHRCYPVLYSIYSLHCADRDDVYWTKAVYLNAHTDVKLLTHLGVEREIWPICLQTSKDLDKPFIIASARDKFYRKAVDTLQRLPSESNPTTKMKLLVETFDVMNKCVREQAEAGNTHVWSGDSLLPAFIYVTIRSQIRHLGSEIQFLDDFSRGFRGDGVVCMLFTMLQSAFCFICNEKSLV